MNTKPPSLFDPIEKLTRLRVLHTADWHLGKCLCDQVRDDEHEAFLSWLFELIVEKQVDVLIVAGDIFDSANPPHSATTMLYRFLTELHQKTDCEAVIVGGNHDSAKLLESVAPLLKTHRVHVVGMIPDEYAKCVLLVGPPSARVVVAAVPFLRDRDVRTSVPGETADEISESLRCGISEVYNQLASIAKELAGDELPIIATGHLTAMGCTSSESERSIHIGGLGAFPSDLFSADFHYVALGHLHRPQSADSTGRIRYSGSPLALSFSESNDVKSVELLEFDRNKLVDRSSIRVPVFRAIISIPCEASNAIETLTHWIWPDPPLGCWLDVTMSNANVESPTAEQLRALINAPHVTLLQVKAIAGNASSDLESETRLNANDAIAYLRNEPQQVFSKRLASEELSDELREALRIEFDQIVEQVLYGNQP